MAEEGNPRTWVSAGNWDDGTAEFDTGNPVMDEALRRMNRAAVLLRQVREDAYLSQPTVARWTGLRRQTIAKLESGLSWPDARTVHLLAVALGLGSDLRPDPHGRMGPRT